MSHRRNGGELPRAHRVLLRLHPRAFHDDFGDGVRETLRLRAAAASAGGRWSRTRFWWREMGGLLASLVRERFAPLRPPAGAGLLHTSDARSPLGVVEVIMWEFRHALRRLLRARSFTVPAVLTLALGIGVNTAVFSVMNAVLLRPFPYPESERLVSVQSRDTRGTPHPTMLSYPTFFDFRENNDVFEHFVSYRDDQFTLTGSGEPVHLRGFIVSWDLFPLLQVQPKLGRGFLPEDEEAGNRVVILSHALWDGQFGGDPAIVGRALTIDGVPYTVVGVAPAGFSFPLQNDPVQLWTTLARDAASPTVTPVTEQRGARMLHAMARLERGVSVEQAQAQLDAVAAAIAREHPDQNKAIASTYVRPALENLIGETREPILILLGAVGLVLLVACANIANLLLVRTTEREREFALRAAIGAGRGRIIWQLTTESLTLSLIGCVLGVFGAYVLIELGLPFVASSVPIPRVQETTLDARVLVFAIALAAITGIVFGLTPAARIARVQLTESLKAGSRTSTDGSGRLRSSLTVAQIALGLALLSGAGLLATSFLHLLRTDLGFPLERLSTFSLNLPHSRYTVEAQLDFHARLMERLRHVPGVSAAALGRPLPLTGSHLSIAFNIEQSPSAPSERPSSDMSIVTPGYFETLGVPLLQGRDFTERDDAQAPPVLIVNRAFADRFFPGESAIGKRIEPGATSGDEGTRMREIVGVVGDVKQSPLSRQAEPIYYYPYQQLPWCCPSVIVRTSASALDVGSSIRTAVASLDEQLAVYDLRKLDDILAHGIARPRFAMLLLGSFAGLALMLTLVGLYGVLSYSVVKRTREIGVRIALGASREAVLAVVMRRAMFLVLAGITLGLAGTVAAGRVMSAMLYGTGPRNPLVLAFACAVIILTGAIAAYLPARRAALIDPIQALRSE